MPGPAFDPAGAVRFDVENGVASDAAGGRFVLVPAAALEAVERSTPGVLGQIGAEIGSGCGRRLAAKLGGSSEVRGATIEVVVSHLAGELAIAGLGAVQLERWGRAMVIVVENAAIESDPFIASALSGALGAATGREVAIAPLGREGTMRRYFVGTQPTAVKARLLVSQGKAWTDVLGILQQVGQ